jgi:hypothetical protein
MWGTKHVEKRDVRDCTGYGPLMGFCKNVHEAIGSIKAGSLTS